jgi:hypothetical protein
MLGGVVGNYCEKKMNVAVPSISEKDAKQLRQQQIDWLDDIMERSKDNLTQMAEACSQLAESTGQKPVNKETLRHFYHGYSSTKSSKADRLLSDRLIFLLYKVYELEPSFAPHMLYDMDKDDAQISVYAKHCKQYITEVSLARGIYRTDLARGIELADSILSRLFSDKLPRGLQMKTLEEIKEKYGVNFSPRFRAFLEKKEDAGAGKVPVIGLVALRSREDRIWPVAEDDRKQLSISVPFGNARAVELEGQDISPFLRGGMMLVYQESGSGVSRICLDQTCVVQTDDDQWHLKVVKRSDKPGYYRLESVISSGIEERMLKCAYKIEMTLMPSA